MNRTGLGIGIVVVLAAVLVLVLTAGGDDPPPSTLAATTSTPPTTAPPTTTTAAPTTTTTTAAPPTTRDLAAREAEVEALVTDLELTMLQALFDQDRDSLAEVVVGEALWESIQTAFGAPEDFFKARPEPDEFTLTLNGILVDRSDCLVADATEDATAFYSDYDQVDEWLVVMWPIEGSEFGWRLVSLWVSGSPESSWMPLCDTPDRTWRP